MTPKPGFRFTAEQLRKAWDRHRTGTGMDIEALTEELNALLDAHVATLPEVTGYGPPDEDGLFTYKNESNQWECDTHSARLWGVTELSKPKNRNPHLGSDFGERWASQDRTEECEALVARIEHLEQFILSRCYCKAVPGPQTCSYCEAVKGENKHE